jgi:hypothetical protein
VGDIVEVQITVVMVPVQRRTFRMVLQLQSLALIDSTFSQVKFLYTFRRITLTVHVKKATNSRNVLVRSPKMRRVLKRKVGYEGEKEDNGRMQVS